MGSMLAFFHKTFNLYERRMRATRRMNKEVQRIQRAARAKTTEKCPKCGELFPKGTLLRDDVSDMDFCSRCMNAISILRDAR